MENDHLRNLSIGQLVSLACVLEVSAPKPGNVHRSADFIDMHLNDFLASAIAIGNVFDQSKNKSVGDAVLESVTATRLVTNQNTNLGLILLLAPLAFSCRRVDGKLVLNQEDVGQTLGRIQDHETAQFYSAISLASPGGLGDSDEFDVNDANMLGQDLPNFVEVMRSSSDRDSISLEYSNNFDTVFKVALPRLSDQLKAGRTLNDAIVNTHVFLMSEVPDTLIARKCGMEVSLAAAAQAKHVLAAPGSNEEYLKRLSDLDFWLRTDGNRRNPGTTADLIGATLFVALVNGIVYAPFH